MPQNDIVLYDNTRPHTALQTHKKPEYLFWTVMEWPPYTPDLSLCDYHILDSLKEELGGHKFDNVLRGDARVYLAENPSSFF